MMSLGALPGCRTCRGCGENVITTDAVPEAAAIRTRSTRMRRWPRWSPSKFPIVTELRCEEGKCRQSCRIFIGGREGCAGTNAWRPEELSHTSSSGHRGILPAVVLRRLSGCRVSFVEAFQECRWFALHPAGPFPAFQFRDAEPFPIEAGRWC